MSVAVFQPDILSRGGGQLGVDPRGGGTRDPRGANGPFAHPKWNPASSKTDLEHTKPAKASWPSSASVLSTHREVPVNDVHVKLVFPRTFFQSKMKEPKEGGGEEGAGRGVKKKERARITWRNKGRGLHMRRSPLCGGVRTILRVWHGPSWSFWSLSWGPTKFSWNICEGRKGSNELHWRQAVQSAECSRSEKLQAHRASSAGWKVSRVRQSRPARTQGGNRGEYRGSEGDLRSLFRRWRSVKRRERSDAATPRRPRKPNRSSQVRSLGSVGFPSHKNFVYI